MGQPHTRFPLRDALFLHASPSRLAGGVLITTLLLAPQYAAACSIDAIRYAATSNRVYIEKPTECTLTDLKAKVKDFVLKEVEPGVWELYTNLFVTQGGTLTMNSRASGGDVDVLRLKSNPGTDSIVHLEINYGQLNVDGIQITSWDTNTQSPDTDIEDGRAYIKARSFKDKITGDARESTINIANSELMNLGYKFNESYGLALKVKAKRTEQYLFDEIDIFGSLINNKIHDNYMGFYSWGAYGLQIRDNEVYNNVLYGIDPHDHSDSLVIDGNHVHDNGSHGIICSTDCKDLQITNNLVENNRHGIMLHQNVTDSYIAHNTLRGNREVGIALYNSHNNVIEDNTSYGNTDGIRLSSGSSDNEIKGNSVDQNTRYSLYMYQGSNIPEDTDGRNKRNRFVDNIIGNAARPVQFRESDNSVLDGNTFLSPASIILKNSPGTEVLAGNEYPDSSTISSDTDFRLGLDEGQRITVIHPDNELFKASAPFNTRSYPGIANLGETRLPLYNPAGNGAVDLMLEEQRIKVVPDNNYIRAQAVSDSNGVKGVEVKSTFDDQEITLTFAALKPDTAYDIIRVRPAPFSAEAPRPVIHDFSDHSGRITATLPLHKAPLKLEFYAVESSAQGPEYVATSLRDSHVRHGNYSKENYGDATAMAIKTDPYTEENTRIAYITFDLSQVDDFSKATVSLKARLHIEGSIELGIFGVLDEQWREENINWDNRPALGGALGTAVIDATQYKPFDMDLSSYFQAQKALGKKYTSIALVSNTPSHAIMYVQAKNWDSYAAGEFSGPLLSIEH